MLAALRIRIRKTCEWRPLSWRIFSLKADLSKIGKQYDTFLKSAADQEARDLLNSQWKHNTWEDYEELDLLLTQQLESKAGFWKVGTPTKNYSGMRHGEDSNWKFSHVLDYAVLTSAGRDYVYRRLWERRIAVWALVVGLGSIIQTIYTVLAYYRGPVK